ncbi:N-acetylglucosamine-6-phosphate deacetylase [Aliivibrio fischeri]|uniref:N-acetylglucosamine-6-phosphate deacetylase n=1 Tax=Aliivibrio fischeri TaxID=668 RepID=UPI001F466258|nr:N-acetylglucosamine-6-phosphate deacetylase [Aliivibrio fischeri]MCE7578828.1 N-acetylglucosamine-6-phosphate deacetylase [Aliivibrio fischeri]MCE7591072.1 N-acetylglucosamine-6-phosphate deacetylase [Aliivibrio fischeri]
MNSTNAQNNQYMITNVDVFNGQKIEEKQAIIINNDSISSIISMKEADSLTLDRIDGEGALATAGFIDIQLNGCGGVLLNTDIALSTLETMNKTNVKYGTTQYLPTLITSTELDLHNTLSMMSNFENAEQEGVLGLHLEGPFISIERKGAHQAQYIRELDLNTAQLLAQHRDQIKVITLAPEHIKQDVLDCLTAAGITVSIGHTNATYDQVNARTGFTMATHLYNAMTPLGSREPGVVGYIFDQKPHAGIIVDGIHASYPSVRIAHEQLKEKLFLVTDAVTPAGTDLTEFDMAGTPAYVTDGKCHYKDGTIAGAAITMIDGVRNLINHVGLSKEEALRMASLYPAQALKIDNEYGQLKENYKANITLIDSNNDITTTIQMGKLVYQK